MTRPSDSPRPLLKDLCAVCDREIWAHHRHWELVKSTEGLAECANTCSPTCDLQAKIDPAWVADRLRKRLAKR